MNNEARSDQFAAIAVALLLILTAWGNALAMLVVSAFGLVVGMLFFRKSMARGGALVATVGFLIAIVIALIMLLR